MPVANRLRRLGTETAFAVSSAANEWGAQGHRIYPFHLGDIDLPTPRVVTEAMNKAIADGRTGYCPGAGIPVLREALADDVNMRRGTSYTAENVVVQPGGKPVITKFLQTVMNEGDEVLYPTPDSRSTNRRSSTWAAWRRPTGTSRPSAGSPSISTR